jgi:hypothetical protein
MRIIDKIILYVKKSRFETEEFVFRGALPKGSDILILLPTAPGIFSLSFSAIGALNGYFRGEFHLYGPEKFANFIEILFENAIYWSERENILDIGIERVDVLWDLNRPPTPRIDIPLEVKATYRVSTDINAYPFFNIIVPINERDDISFFSTQLSSLGIPLRNFLPKFSPQARRIAWDFLIYKGHREENVLIFWDLDTRNERVLKYLGNFFENRITYVTSGSNPPGFINLESLDLEGIIASLSLSHLYVGGNTLFLGPAFFLKIPILLVSDDIRLPEGGKWFKDTDDEEDFYEKLKEILE